MLGEGASVVCIAMSKLTAVVSVKAVSEGIVFKVVAT